jgi:hypothetical protein
MGAVQGTCKKTIVKTPFGTIGCNGCGSSCVKELPQEAPEDIAERARIEHTLNMIGRLVGSESTQVQNNFSTIVRELLAAGVPADQISVEHQVHSPKPGLRMMTTRIVHTGDTPPLTPKDIVFPPLPPTLHPVEEQSNDSESPPPANPPTLIRQNAIQSRYQPPFRIPSPPFRQVVLVPSPPQLVREL